MDERSNKSTKDIEIQLVVAFWRIASELRVKLSCLDDVIRGFQWNYDDEHCIQEIFDTGGEKFF